ncbi:MAG: iron ABC transporter permease [Candidatus Binatia bacterium]
MTSIRQFCAERVRWDDRTLVMLPVIGFTTYLVVLPLAFLVWASFRSTAVGVLGSFTLANYVKVYGDPATYSLLKNTVLFSVGSAGIALALGVSFAWLLERTNVPFRNVAYFLIPVPLAIPGVLFSIGWILLLSPTIGIMNRIMVAAFDLQSAPVNIYSLTGMIFLEGLRLTPITFLMMAGAFKRMDPVLEEASSVSGASTFVTFSKITTGVLRPAILATLLYIFISAMEAFEVPGVIGMRAGTHVLALRIFLAKQENPPDYGTVSTLSVSLLAVSALLVIVYGKITRESQKFSTITGKDYRPRIIDLGGWKYFAFGSITVYFLFAVALPVLTLFWASLLPFYEVPSASAFSSISLSNYSEIWNYPKVGLAFRNTLLMVLMAPTLTMLLSSLISWFVVKGSGKGRRTLDIIAFLPHAVPGIVVGVALLWTYSFIPLPIYGTVWILLIAYLTNRIPFGTRIMNAALTQLHKDLEEASYASGGSWFKTFKRITLPLMIPTLVNGWIVSAVIVAQAMGSVIMLYSSDSIVLPVLIWELWEDGNVPGTAAIGMILIMGLIAAAFLGRRYVTRVL